MSYTAAMAETLEFSPNTYWASGPFTFSIAALGSTWPGYDAGSEPFNAQYGTLNSQQAALFRAAIAAWDKLIVPDFVETNDPSAPGQIRIAITATTDYLPGAAAYANGPPTNGVGSVQSGDIWLRNGNTSNNLDNIDHETTFSSIMVHEIGHALGLRHPDDAPGFDQTYDSMQYSVLSSNGIENITAMSFRIGFDANGIPDGSTFPSFNNATVLPTGPMVLDIAAIQALYGADPDTEAGDNVYRWDEHAFFLEGLYDAGGIDTFDLSGSTRSSSIDLTPGSYSSIYKWSVAEQEDYWVSQFPQFEQVIRSLSQANLQYIKYFTWENNLGISFSTVIENVIGGGGADLIKGNYVSNALSGMAGDDIISGDAGNDQLFGGDGDDLLEGGTGADALGGGTGFDYAVYSNATSAVRVSLLAPETNTGEAAGDIYTSIEGVKGSAYNDTLAGDAAANVIQGGAGNDVIFGGAGADTFRYLAAADSKPDAYDIITDFSTGGDVLDLKGVAPIEVSLVRSGATTFVFVNAPGGAMTIAANGDVNGADVLTHDGHGVYMIGDAGPDTLIGGATGDVLQSGNGDDILIGGGGGDVLFGQAGADTFKYRAVGDSNANGADGLFVFETGVDKIDLSAVHPTEVSLIRSGGSTFLFANTPNGPMQLATVGYDLNGRDVITGDGHGFYIIGDSTADALIGGATGDVIQAGGGNDVVIGGGGGDAIWGGAGADVFKYLAAADSQAGGADTLFDFQSGLDRIDLTGVRTGASDQIGTLSSGGSTFIFVDLHGDGTSDMTLQLNGVASIAAGDILF